MLFRRIVFILAIFAFWPGMPVPCFSQTRTEMERPLASKSQLPEVDDRWLVVSPDARHLAAVTFVNNEEAEAYAKELTSNPKYGKTKMSDRTAKLLANLLAETPRRLVYDGKKGAIYEDIFAPVHFSESGDRFAYLVKKEGKPLLVVDGKEDAPQFSQVQGCGFTRDGSHFVCIGSRSPQGDNCFLTVDGKDVSNHESFRTFPKGRQSDEDAEQEQIFFPDADHFIAVAEDKNALWIHRDGVDQGPYEKARSETFRFTPDKKHFAYVAKKGGQFRIIIDGELKHTTPNHVMDETFTVSPDGKHFACILKLKKNRVRLLLDKAGYDFKGQANEHAKVVFSADSQHCLAHVGNRVVLDGKVMGETSMKEPFFAPGGGVCFIKSGGESNYVAVLSGGAEEKFSRRAKDVRFSPDGKRFACIKSVQQFQRVTCDGQEGLPFSNVRDLRFSANGTLFSYIGYTAPHSTMVVVNGKNYPANNLHSPVFLSPDGKHFAYVLSSRGKDMLVINGQFGKTYSRILLDEKRPPVFFGEKSVRYVALKDDIYVSFEETWP